MHALLKNSQALRTNINNYVTGGIILLTGSEQHRMNFALLDMYVSTCVCMSVCVRERVCGCVSGSLHMQLDVACPMDFTSTKID